MVNFFGAIVEYIKVFFNYLVGIVQNTISAFQTLGSAIASLPLINGVVPSFLSAAMSITVGIVVVNYLLGRSNQ